MKKRTGKIAAFLLAVVMLVAAFGGTALAEEAAPVTDAAEPPVETALAEEAAVEEPTVEEETAEAAIVEEETKAAEEVAEVAEEVAEAATEEAAEELPAEKEEGADLSLNEKPAKVKINGYAFTTTKSVEIAWTPVSDVDGYKIKFYNFETEKWETVATVTGASKSSWIYTPANDGIYVRYSVAAYKGSEEGDFDTSEIWCFCYMSDPMAKVTKVTGGAKVSWNEVQGADQYKITRIDKDSLDTEEFYTEETSYTDASYELDRHYVYYVIAIKTVGGTDCYGYQDSYKPDADFQVNSAPELKSADTVLGTGIELKWAAKNDTKKYIVYRKTQGGTLENIGETTETTFMDTTATPGVLYIYTVNTISTYGQRGNYDKTGIGGMYLSEVNINTCENKGSKVLLKWDAVEGAAGYRVYKRVYGDTKWTAIKKSVTGTTYYDASGTGGAAYEYLVKAYSSYNGRLIFGLSNSSPEYIIKVAQPELIGTSEIASGIKVRWKASEGADGYVLARKEVGGEWEGLKLLSGTTWVDKTAEPGKIYVYTVIALSGADYSSYSETGVKGIWLATPKLSKISSTTKGITVYWKAVAGATSYKVYRKSGSGSYTQIGTSTSTSFKDTTGKKGVKYTYTVRAISSKVTSCVSDVDDNGISAVCKAFTGFVTKNGRTVYYESGKLVIGWKKIGSSWYYFNSTGRMIKGTEYQINSVLYHFNKSGVCRDYNKDGSVSKNMTAKAQNYDSATNWLIMVDCGANRCGVYYYSGGKWVQKYFWACTTGRASDPTVKGEYTVSGNRGYSFGEDHGYSCYWYSSFYGPYLFHSVKYYPSTNTIKDGRLGQSLSLGCVRLEINNAKWIYDNIPVGTKVVTYKN